MCHHLKWKKLNDEVNNNNQRQRQRAGRARHQTRNVHSDTHSYINSTEINNNRVAFFN